MRFTRAAFMSVRPTSTSVFMYQGKTRFIDAAMNRAAVAPAMRNLSGFESASRRRTVMPLIFATVEPGRVTRRDRRNSQWLGAYPVTQGPGSFGNADLAQSRLLL